MEIVFESSQPFQFSPDVFHLDLRADIPNASKLLAHAFFFSSGAFVTWGLPSDTRKHLFSTFATFQEVRRSHFANVLKMMDFEHDFRYTVDTSRSQPNFRNDEIHLVTFNAAHLLAFSYGLAQSVRLLVYEEAVDALVARTRTLPDELADVGHVQLSQRELKRLIGELLAARYSVNLVSDILDTPEYFWQHAELERLHLECANEVELRQRVKILDNRTDVIKDALDLLNNELSSSSSDRVERAILFLIAVEVAIELGKALLPVA